VIRETQLRAKRREGRLAPQIGIEWKEEMNRPYVVGSPRRR
jgi:hypothetical protein